MGSTVRHSTVENGGLVAAGAVIADNIVVKEGEVNYIIYRFGQGIQENS